MLFLNKNINWIVFLIALFWVFTLDIPIVAKVVLFCIQSAVVYITFYTRTRIRSCIMLIILTLSLIMISANISKHYDFIMTFWPSVFCYPFLAIIYFIKLKEENKNILLAILLAILFKYSISTYTLVAYTSNHGKIWMAIGLYIIEILLFSLIPVLYSDILNKINYEFNIKTCIRSMIYLMFFIAIHQIIYFLTNHRLHSPQVTDIKEMFLYFGATLLTTSIIEEQLYRGFLYEAIHIKTKSTQQSMIITAILFGLAHIQLGLYFAILTAIVGYTLGKIYQKTSSLMYPIVIHTLLNLYL